MDIEKIKIDRLRKDSVDIYNAGLKAVDPGVAVGKYCRREDNRLVMGDQSYDLSTVNDIIVVGAGKASAAMAHAVEAILGNRIKTGIINVKYGHVAELNTIELIEAGHPVPDENGENGSRAILDLVQNAQENDLVICLMSGGGSALMPLAAQGLTLDDKQDVIKVLLACGASIHEINTIRKHTSSIKGGRLTRASYPASLIALILSDVVGDDLDVIASGPTVPDSSTFGDCREIFKKYGIMEKLPASVISHIEAGIADDIFETPKTGDSIFDRTHNLIIGSNTEAIMAAKQKAESLGYNTLILSSMIEGETRHVAHVHGAIAREIKKTGHPVSSPACILSGGETTVTITGNGIGGRNQEFSLAAAMDIAAVEDIVILSGGTDGNDGPTDAAGAIADTDTCQRAVSKGLNPQEFLKNNDSYHFFQALGDLFITGPTNTNVMDLRIILVG